jgi:glycerophosphoryl diester phosphodiesterase
MKRGQVAVNRQSPWIVILTFFISFILVVFGSLYTCHQYFKLEQNSVSNYSGLTISHRGCIDCPGIPENSFKALDHVIAKKFDGLEIDIQVTSDDQVVVIHDSTISRVAKQNQLSNDRLSTTISQLTLSNLKHYFVTPEHTTIPALSEFLARMQVSSTTLRLVIEVKEYVKTDVVIKELLHHFKVYGFHDRVLVSSYNPIFLYAIKKNDPKISTVLLTRRNLMSEWFNKQSTSKPGTIEAMNKYILKIVEFMTPVTDWFFYKSTITWIPSFIGVEHICLEKSTDLEIVKDFKRRGYQPCVFLGKNSDTNNQIIASGAWTIKNT